MPMKPKRRPMPPRPPLTVAQILTWADAHHAAAGEWPKTAAGVVLGDPSEKWLQIDMALRLGLRGLPAGDSLASLLERERGVREVEARPRLTEAKICRWAEAHCRQTGAWPDENSGPVEAAPGEVWQTLNESLRLGLRGLRGDDSVAQLLGRRLGIRSRTTAAPLSVAQVLSWAMDHESRTGRLPDVWSGSVRAVLDETWQKIDDCLRRGRRGLPGGGSLAQLLAERRPASRRR
jgi:hypothetical protein